MNNMTKIKCFFSYHDDDREEVEKFIEDFDLERDIAIVRRTTREMCDEVIDCDDTDYLMTRLRELYLKRSIVTIVLLGGCTWASRYVDWEIQASLRCGETFVPNGLLGIKLPSYPESGCQFPSRLTLNLKHEGTPEQAYGEWIDYPTERELLLYAIENAARRRETHQALIVNPKERLLEDRLCRF
jgi:hypothetical protein